MNIAWATDRDAARIKALLLQDGLNLEGGDWTGLGQTWLVARDDADTVQACMAVHHGRPVARIDFLSVDHALKGLSRARAVKAILETAMAVMAARGASFATGVVPHYLPDYGDVIASYGGKVLNEGWLFIGALSEVLGKINHGRRKQNDDDDYSHPDGGREGIHPPAD